MDAAPRSMYAAWMGCSPAAVLTVLAAAVAAACASSARGAPGSSVREGNCGFDIVGDPPGPGYVEIARISLEGETNFGAGRYRDSRRSANTLREMVCELGGDAVAEEVNARGEVVRAIVFRRRTPSADPS
jgi:hypothetical protein